MLPSILLDAILVVILLMMVPLGFLRGGLREVCTAAGLMFGMLLANEWAGPWGTWLAERLDVEPGAARFLVAVVIVVLAGSVLGYGGSAAFSYRPGPGGRMYGAYIALFNGIVLAGYLINRVIARVYDGTAPDLIANSYVARALSAGFGWVLLVCALGVLGGTLFGMFVRERPDDAYAYAYPPQPAVAQPAPRQPASQAPPEVSPVTSEETEPSPQAPVRIREVRHWEEPQAPARPEQGYGSGWRQTWPDPRGQGPVPPWEQRPAPRPPASKRAVESPRKPDDPQASPRDVLRDWMEGEGADEGD